MTGSSGAADTARTRRGRARDFVPFAGLLGGPLLGALLMATLPHEYLDASGSVVSLGDGGRATLGLMAWMAVWWMTEALPLAATALLPIAVLPLAGAASIGDATAPYADKLIFLFLGGFALALAIQRWGLDRRIALAVLRLVGTRPAAMVAGVMGVTAVLSMFVSNTATAAMMLPIALSVVALLRAGRADTEPAGGARFATCLLLGIAYAASIGGIATKIGTPPNGLLLAFIERRYGHAIDFLTWLGVGLPLVLVFLPITWWLLAWVLYPVPRARIPGAQALLARAQRELGPVSRGEWASGLVFAGMALAWVTRPLLAGGYAGGFGPRIPALVPGLSDAGIAVAGAIALFAVPVDLRRRVFVLDWETAVRMPWGILLLFGGGLSLAAAVRATGVDAFIGSLAAGMSGLPPLLVIAGVSTLVILLTELTSNTATTATLLPVLAPVAVSLALHPYALLVPAAIAASCAFMLPVATPPNAIVFGSGEVTIGQMSRAGIWLNLIGVCLVTGLSYAIVVPWLSAAAPG